MSNENQIRIYDSTGATPINDPDRLLDRATDITFSTVYPGGIFDACAFFIPCDPTRYSPIAHNQRLQIKNGLTTVWEGFITSKAFVIAPDRIGLDIQATGYWSLALNSIYRYNRWIDRRYSSTIYGVWHIKTDATAADKCDYDQTERLQFVPKNVLWANGEYASIKYIANASSNIKRITFDYDFSELGQDSPVRAKKYTDSGATWTANLPNLIDGNVSTTQAVQLAANDLLYVGIPIDKAAGITGFRFDFDSTVNNNAATLTVEYYTNAGTWQSITITDGTASGGAPWAVDGSVTFTEIDGLNWVAVNGSQQFVYFRFGASAALDNVVIKNIFVLRQQAWELRLYDETNAAALWTVSATGTGSQDITLSPTASGVRFEFTSKAAQTAEGDGTIYGTITNLAVIAEGWDGTSGTTVEYIMQHMVHFLGTRFANTNYTYLEGNTYDLITDGFVADDLQQTLGKQMMAVGTYSALNNAYSVGALESDVVQSNTLPVIYYETIPALTDYDYAIRLDEPNIAGVELVTSSEVTELFNDVYVLHEDSSGFVQWANYTDDALLRDATSVTKYGDRVKIVNGGQSATRAGAGVFGRPYVTRYKDLQYYMRGPLQLVGTVRKADGSRVPVSQIRAGKRIKIENFINDVGDVIDGGLIFLINRTEYDDNTGVLSASTGASDDLPTYLAARGSTGTGEQSEPFEVGVSHVGYGTVTG